MKKADSTRWMILNKAFELIYIQGYQATSIDQIISTTKVTKGAFYYHFKTKDEMGLAVINEVLQPGLSSPFSQLLNQPADPLEAIYHLMHHLLMENAMLKVEYGCPVSNLAQEMGPVDDAFQSALRKLNKQWIQLLSSRIEKGKKAGFVSPDVHAKQATEFILSGYWGVRTLGKLSGTREVYKPYLKELKKYLDGLK